MSLEAETVLELEDFKRGILGMESQAEQRASAFFMELKPSGRGDVRDHQKQRKSPAGAWPPRTAATQQRAKRKSKTKRRKGPNAGLLGNLPRSWKVFVSSDHMKFLHRVEWVGVHDKGGVAGHGARIAARQFSYWSAGFIDSAARQYGAYVLKGWTK